MASDINHIINNSGKFGMSQVIKLLHWMAMRVENTWVFVGDDFVDVAFDWFDKLNIFNWRISRNLFLSLMCGIDIDPNHSFYPLFKLGHFLSWKLIPASRDVNRTVIIKNKLSVFKSPSIVFEPLFFVADVLGSFNR